MTEIRRVLMIGKGEDADSVYAEHDGTHVRFAFHLRDGKSAVVTVPKLGAEQAANWVRRRMERFKKYDESRESVEDAIRRKAIAAQGRPFLAMLSGQLDRQGKNELKTMFSPDSHSQGIDLEKAEAASHVDLTIAVSGDIKGLSDSSLRDNTGRLLEPKRGG